MTNRLPAELHLVHGTNAMHKAQPLPEKIRLRVPQADWLDNPDAWDRSEFIKQTSDFLWETYGIGSDQDKHVLAALATQIEIYIECWKTIQDEGLTIIQNAKASRGANPCVSIGDKALVRAVALMNELGLTPKSRLATGKQEGGKYSRLLNGP
jgi:P27 family predicted phage terminase small subunit